MRREEHAPGGDRSTLLEHLDLELFNPVPLVDAMEKMAFQARNTAKAAKIYERMRDMVIEDVIEAVPIP